jgi:hypothetical protein
VNQSDKRAFAESLGGLLELYGRKITPAAAGLWWGAFETYPLAAVQAAFSRYAQDPEQGRYPPTPAAVLGCLPNHGPDRLTADEAWSIALETFDEAATVCVTDEILEAVAVASPVWETGDKIGARMAFKSAYERITAQRRQHGQSPTWQLSLGWDVEQRGLVAQEALRLGRLSHDQVKHYLPAPKAEGPARVVAGLLTGNVVEMPLSEDAKQRANLSRLRDAVSAGLKDARKRDPVEDRRDFLERKRAALEDLERIKGGADGAA